MVTGSACDFSSCSTASTDLKAVLATHLDLKALELGQAAIKVEHSVALLDEFALLLAGREDHRLAAKEHGRRRHIRQQRFVKQQMATQQRPTPSSMSLNLQPNTLVNCTASLAAAAGYVDVRALSLWQFKGISVLTL